MVKYLMRAKDKILIHNNPVNEAKQHLRTLYLQQDRIKEQIEDKKAGKEAPPDYFYGKKKSMESLQEELV